MGVVIRKNRAVDDIFGDAKKTQLAADARGGEYKKLVDEYVVPFLVLGDQIAVQLEEVSKLLAVASAKVEVQDEVADDVVADGRDTIYNETGRRADDPYFVLFFPQGLQGLIQNDTIGQPARMGLLVQLLKSGVHPKLSKQTADKVAADIEAVQKDLQAAIDELLPLRAKHESLTATYSALARATQMALVNVKRALKSKGESETSIHEVIPDRS